MTYVIANPPRLVTQSVGANGGDLWVYKDGDTLNSVAAVNYVSNAADLGLKAGDAVLHVDTTDLVTNLLTAVAHRTSGTASGALCSAIEPIGESSIALQSAGTGTFLIDDIVTFDNDLDTEYRITTGDADISGGGTLVITPVLVKATAVGTGIKVKSGVVNLSTGKTGRKVHASSPATRLIQPSESGDMFLFDSADGQVFTLPTAVVGLKYSFMTTVTVTAADTYGLLTSTATAGDFFAGAVIVSVEGSGSENDTYFADGAADLGVVSNGSTTGGLIGGWIEIECLTTAVWSIKAVLNGTGTITTPLTT